MKYLKVITSSPGLSGAGLISDFLLSRKDFTSPFKNNPDEDQQSEFRFVSDPGGLISLYKGFYENFSINNCAYLYDEFNKYLDKINFPSDLKTLELNELKILAEELRTELI